MNARFPVGLIAFGCGVFLAATGEVRSQPPLAQQPIRIQRVLLPENAQAESTEDSKRYLPIAAARFERWLASRQGHEPLPSFPARVRTAEYEASLDEHRRLVGRTQWQIEYRGATPSILTLAPYHAHFALATWRTFAADSPAVIGMTGEQFTGALVENSGALEAAWQLEPAATLDNERRYRVRLAPCLDNLLSLALPAALQLSVQPGLAARDGAPRQGVQRWKIQPDARLELEVRIKWPEGELASPSRLAVRQSTDYRLALDGLTMETTFERVAQRWPDTVSIVLPRGVRLLEATRSGAALPWERAAAVDELERIAIALPADPLGGSGPIQLVCRAEFSSGRPVALPALQLESAQWEEGSARILTAAPLRVSRLEVSHARQTALDADGAIRVQLFEPDAAIQVVARESSAPIPVLRGVSLVAEGARLSGVLIAEFAGPRNDSLEIQAKVSDAWTVDALEVEPLGAVESWRQDEGWLNIRWSAAGDERRPTRLKIRGHRFLESTGQLSAADLRMLEFENTASRRDLMSLRAAEPLTIEPRYEQDLTLVTPQDLDLESAALLDEPPQGLCFAYDDSAERLRVSFLPAEPEFSAEMNTAVSRQGESWSEEFRLRIAPGSRPLEEVFVRLSEPRDGLTWRLDGERAQQPAAAQLLSREELAKRGSTETDCVYRVSLPAAQPTAFELVGRVDQAPASMLQVALPTMVGAASQVGRVTLSSTIPCEVKSSSPLERLSAQGDRAHAWSAVYRYDAARPGGELRLSVAAPSVDALPHALWAWQETVETRVAADGERVHTITHFLENRSATTLRLEWPPELSLISLQLDGHAQLPDSEAGGARVRLSLGKRFQTMTCEFKERGAKLGSGRALRAPRVETHCPVVMRSWRLGVPTRYCVWCPQGEDRLSWSARLLGPLARPAGPSAPDAWFAAFQVAPGASGAWRVGLFDTLAAASVSLASVERPTWGQWFAGWQAGLVPSGAELWVDPSAAARLGIDPRDIAPRWSSQPTREEVEVLLADAGWTVHLAGGVVVLSDRGAQPEDRALAAGEQTLLPVMNWRTGEGTPRSPWSVSPPRYVGAAGPPLRVVHGDWAVVVRREVWPATFALLALAVATAAGLAYRFRPRLAVALGAACALVAALVPAGWAAVAAALPVGWMLGSALHAVGWFRRSRVLPGIARGVILVLGTTASLAAAAELAGPASTPVYRVLIPVDAERQPRGTEYFVPLELLNLLERDEQAASWPGGSPLLWTGVDYRLELSAGGPARLLVTCDLLSLAPDHRFVWPGADPRWELADLRLDGRSVPLEDRAAATLFLAETGRHRAELVFRVADNLQPSRRLEFVFPQQPRARVSVHGGAQLLEPQPASAGSAAASEPVEALGAARLSALVPDSSATPAAFERRELYWMHVRPDYVTIEAHLPRPEGSLSTLSLQSDQPLQVVAGDGNSSPNESAARPGFRLELPQRGVEGSALRTTLLANSSGVGRVSWPNLRGPGNRVRWLAVSIDPSLTWTLPPPDLTRAVAPSDFLHLWGETTSRPAAVVELPADPLEWAIETAPRPPTTRGKMVAECDLGLRRAHLVATAELDTTAGYVLTHVVGLPPGFVLEAAAVSQEGNDRLAYGAREGDSLTLFLTSPVSGPHRLRIEGSVPVGQEGELTLAALTLADVATEPFELRLFRRVSALTELTHVQDAVRQDLPSPTRDDSSRRPLARLTATGPAFAARLHIGPNEPQVISAQLVRPRPGETSPRYEVDVVVQIAAGKADALRFRLPPGWPRPAIQAPGALVDWLEGPGGDVVLSLRFRTPLAGLYRFRALDWGDAATEDARLPYLASLDDDRWQRYFSPLGSTARTPAFGFATAELPSALAAGVPAHTPIWRVTSLEATWRASAAEFALPAAVDLADHSLYRDDAGPTLLNSVFFLRPAAARELTLALPEGGDLLSVVVEGQPAFAKEAAPGSWILQLASSELPQRLEAAVLQPSPRAQGNYVAPRLYLGGQELPVGETLWTVCDERWGAVAPSASSSADLELRRLSRIRDLVTSTVAESPSRDASDWLRIWLARWNDAARFACAGLTAGGKDGAVDQAGLLRRTTARQQQDLVETASQRGWRPFASAAHEEAGPIRAFWACVARPIYRSVGSGDRATLAIAAPFWKPIVSRAAIGISLACALLAAGAIAVPAIAGLPGAPAWAWVALGILWWAFCVVPAGGLGLAAWAVWQACPRAWRVPSQSAG